MDERDIFVGRASLVYYEGSPEEREIPCETFNVNGVAIVHVTENQHIAHFGNYIAVVDSEYSKVRFEESGYITRAEELHYTDTKQGYHIPFAGRFAYACEGYVISFDRRRIGDDIFWEMYLYRPDGKLVSTSTVKGDYELKGRADGCNGIFFVNEDEDTDLPDIHVIVDMPNEVILLQ